MLVVFFGVVKWLLNVCNIMVGLFIISCFGCICDVGGIMLLIYFVGVWMVGCVVGCGICVFV